MVSDGPQSLMSTIKNENKKKTKKMTEQTESVQAIIGKLIVSKLNGMHIEMLS